MLEVSGLAADGVKRADLHSRYHVRDETSVVFIDAALSEAERELLLIIKRAAWKLRSSAQQSYYGLHGTATGPNTEGVPVPATSSLAEEMAHLGASQSITIPFIYFLFFLDPSTQ